MDVVIGGDGGVVGCVCFVVGVVIAVNDFAGFAGVTSIVSSDVLVVGLDGVGLVGVGVSLFGFGACGVGVGDI